MNTYRLIEPDLVVVAEKSIIKIQQRFNTRNVKIETPFDSSINYTPTLHWKTKTHIIVCDIAISPFPNSIRDFYSDIAVKGLPVKIIIAYPENRQTNIANYRKEINKAKEYGIGLIALDENENISIENIGVSIPLHLPSITLTKYKKKLRPFIEEAFEAYMLDGKPDVGLQKLGQLIENIILNLAIEAKKKGNFTDAGFNPPVYIAQSSLLVKLIRDNIIEVGILGNCKSFGNDRNSVSHKPKSRKQAIIIEEKLKASFLFGLRILELLPEALRNKSYKLKP